MARKPKATDDTGATDTVASGNIRPLADAKFFIGGVLVKLKANAVVPADHSLRRTLDQLGIPYEDA